MVYLVLGSEQSAARLVDQPQTVKDSWAIAAALKLIGGKLISILIGVLLAILVYALCVMLGAPSIIGIVAAILVLLCAFPYRDRL